MLNLPKIYQSTETKFPSFYSNIKLLPNDIVIFSSSPIPGNASSVSKTINKLYLKGVKVYTNGEYDIHSSGHANQEELKLMLRLFNPDQVSRSCLDKNVISLNVYSAFNKRISSFKSFTKSDEEKDFVRTLSQTNIVRDLKDVNKITLVFIGTGFLRYMVRNMVGTLIEIGEGKRRSEEIIDILKSEDRTKAGKIANPEGLYLKNVFY